MRNNRNLSKDRRKDKTESRKKTFLCPRCRLYGYMNRVEEGEEWKIHLRMHQQHLKDEREWVWGQKEK